VERVHREGQVLKVTLDHRVRWVLKATKVLKVHQDIQELLATPENQVILAQLAHKVPPDQPPMVL